MNRRHLAVIRVRGPVNVRANINYTLKLLRLSRVNHCVLIENNPDYLGMLQKVKDYITWGEISLEMLEELITKRGRITGNKRATDQLVQEYTSFSSIKDFAENLYEFQTESSAFPQLKPIFRLSPPRKGYERGGIKIAYSVKGALGYRGDAINSLLKRMV
ncbi:MAG: 50S ribosomal protein L30 [Candidatus Hermodarchaeota archaeon]